MLDTQEGVVEMIKSWKIWQEIQYNLGQKQAEGDRELNWGIGNWKCENGQDLVFC